MTKRLALSICLCLSVLFTGVLGQEERPVVNIPLEFRESNWRGPSYGQGSCTWAVMVSLLRWQGRYNTAGWLRKTHGDGAWPTRMARELDEAGIRYAFVTNGDVAFLEWACRTRRGVGITVFGSPTLRYPNGVPGGHMVALVHLDEEWAAILDSNNTSRFTWIPREELIAEWKASRGWAIAPVYTPAAPLPQ